MKDYTFREEDSETFILNYEIQNGMIVVYLANGKVKVDPYIEENEKQVLKKMKEQTLYLADYTKEFYKRQFMDFIGGVLGFGSCYAASRYFLEQAMDGIGLIVYGIGFWICGNMFVHIPEYDDIIKDIHKTKLFVQNEQMINDHFDIALITLYGMGYKTSDLCLSTIGDRTLFTLNTVDRLSPSELDKVIGNIKSQLKKDKTMSIGVKKF